MVDVFEKILSYVVIAVILLVLILTAITIFQPYLTPSEQFQNILVDPISVMYENIPCMINCYTDLMGEEVALLSQQPFNDIDDAPFLINWFPCNNKIMTIAVLINEMVKWDWDGVEGKLVPGALKTNFFNNAVKLLYDCITNPYSRGKCTDDEMSFFFFCDEDDYLTSYGFIPCADRNTFFDHLNKGYLLFSHRTGRDIDNDFICDSDIGDAYNPPYALCTPEEDVRYDEQDCKPSWVILQEQETQELGVRELAKGRCEDFALLYYSLFRSIGLKPEDMELKLGYCDLPCPCKELVRKLEPCGFDYEKEMCFVPANLSFPTLGYKDIDGCDGVQGLPDDYRGRFKITVSGDGQGYFWVINQNFTGDNNSPVFRNLVLDSNYTNDDWWTNLNGVPYESIDMINGGPMIYESTDIGLKAKYGFEVSVDLEACEDNDTLLVYLGFEDEAGGPADLTYYLLTHGETRGVVHEGPLIGPVTYGYFIGNPACFDGATPRFSFDITPGTEGLILQDACRSFYANSGLDHSIEGLITACEKYLSYGRNSTTGMDVGLDVIPDIIAALGCSVE